MDISIDIHIHGKPADWGGGISVVLHRGSNYSLLRVVDGRIIQSVAAQGYLPPGANVCVAAPPHPVA